MNRDRFGVPKSERLASDKLWALRAMVQDQQHGADLWDDAVTGLERRLQAELIKLHAAIIEATG